MAPDPVVGARNVAGIVPAAATHNTANVILGIPVRAPLPHVTGHVLNPFRRRPDRM
jgi:hypothetical protein